jgi:TP901 family phage tail tape measure protein
MATIGSLIVSIGADISGLDSGIQSAQSSLNNFGKNLRNLGAGLSLAVTTPLALMGKQAISASGNFEQGMNVLQQVLGATDSDMAKLEQTALKLGAASVFSAQDVVDAQTELAKAGFTTQQVLEASAGTIALAAAGGLDMANAANIAGAALNSFGLDAGQAAAVADLLAATANASAVDVTDLGDSLVNVGAVASSAGLSIEEVATLLGVMGNAGLKGSEAGTALRTVLRGLAVPTDDALSLMSDLGVAVYDAGGNMNDIRSIIGQLGRSLDGLSDQERNSALQSIFGAYGVTGANILLAAGVEGFDAMAEAATKTGAAQEAAAARMKGFNGALEELKGALETAMIVGMQPFLALATRGAQIGAEFIGWVIDLPEPLRNMAVVLAAVAAATGPVMVGVGLLVQAMAAALPVVGAIAGAMGLLLSPVGLVAAGLAALAVWLWRIDFGGVATMTRAAAAQMAAFANAVALGEINLQQIAMRYAKFARAWAQWKVAPMVQGLRELAKVGAPVIEVLQDVQSAVQGFVTGDLSFGAAVDQAVSGLRELPGAVREVMGGIDWAGLMEGAGGIVTSIRGKIGEWVAEIDWAGAFEAGTSAGTGIRDAVLGAIGQVDWSGGMADLRDRMAGLRDSVVGAVAGIDWRGGLDSAAAFGAGLIAWRNEMAARVAGAIAGFDWAGVGSALAGWVGGLGDAIANVDVGFLSWDGFIKGALLGPLSTALMVTKWAIGAENLASLRNAVLAGLSSIDWSAVGGAFAGLVGSVGDWVLDLGAAILDGVASEINGIDWRGMSLALGGIVSWVGDAIGAINWREGAYDVGASLIGLTGAIVGALASIDWGALLRGAANVGENVAGAVVEIASGLTEAITGAVAGVDWQQASWDFSGMVSDWSGKIASIDWGGLGSQLAENIRGLWSSIFAPGEGQENPIRGLYDAIAAALTAIEWGQIGTALAGFGDAAKQAVVDFVSAIFSGLTVDMNTSLPGWVDSIVGWEWPAFDWPTLPEWAWPDYLDWVWPEFIWDWPGLPRWTWPEIPRPSWWGSSSSDDSGGGGGGGGSGGYGGDAPGKNAAGTSYWGGGLSWVGERGRELVALPRGARVWSNTESEEMALGGGGTINFYGTTINNEMDLQTLEYRMESLLNKKRRR